MTFAPAVGIGPVTAALVQALQADAGVIALVPAERIANYIKTGTVRPYLRVGVVSEVADDTLARGGVDAVCEVSVASDYRGADEIGRIAFAVRLALDARELAIAGFMGPADVGYEQAAGEFEDDVAGVTVRHRPLLFRVRVI